MAHIARSLLRPRVGPGWRSSLATVHLPASRNDEPQRPPIFQPTGILAPARSLGPNRSLHSTARRESILVTGGIMLAVTGYSGRIILNAWSAHQEARAKEETANPKPPPEPETGSEKENSTKAEDSTQQPEEKPFDFQEWWKNLKMPSMPSADSVKGMRYYAGGFEDKMTRREAAQVLGIRESADAKRIKTAHRKILIANHPDKGGSPYMAAKINEAKEMLIKGKEDH